MSSNISAEGELLEYFKWPNIAMRLLGYFPFQTKNGQLRPLKSYCDWSIAVTGIFISFIIAHDIIFAMFYSTFMELALLRRETDKFIIFVFDILVSITMSSFRAYLPFYATKFHEQWKLHCETVQNICNCKQFSSEENNWVIVEGMGGSNRRRVFGIVSLVVVNILAMLTAGWIASYGLNGFEVYNPKGEEKLTFVVYVLISGWSLLRILHAIATVWLACFIQLYAALFTRIGDELESLKKQLEEDCSPLEISKASIPLPGFINGRLEHCIKAFYWSEELVSNFTCFFGKAIVLDTLTSILGLLSMIYFHIFWFMEGSYLLNLSSFTIVLIYAYKIYVLSTESMQMTIMGKQISKRLMALCWHRERFDPQTINRVSW